MRRLPNFSQVVPLRTRRKVLATQTVHFADNPQSLDDADCAFEDNAQSLDDAECAFPDSPSRRLCICGQKRALNRLIMSGKAHSATSGVRRSTVCAQGRTASEEMRAARAKRHARHTRERGVACSTRQTTRQNGTQARKHVRLARLSSLGTRQSTVCAQT